MLRIPTTIRRTLAVAFSIAACVIVAAPAGAAPSREEPSFSMFGPPVLPRLWFELLPNQAPEFTGYLTCAGGYVYADFEDPDQPDQDLTVILYSVTTDQIEMDLVDGGAGFFWAAPVQLPSNHQWVTVYAVDSHGDGSGSWKVWMANDGSCGSPQAA